MEMRLWKTFQQSMHSFSLKILYELWRQSFRMLSARSGEIAIVQQSFEPGMTVSLVARQHGVAASQLFLWRKQYQEGSLTALAAGEQVVPASELAAAMKQIKELQRLLGKKTMENELLKEAVEYGRAKSG